MADSAYIFGRTLREFPSVLYDSISPAPIPTGIAPDLAGAGNVLGEVAFDAMQSAYRSAPSDPIPSGLQATDPIGINSIWRGLTGGESTPVQEPLSTPPPSTPQPVAPAQGGGFEGGGPATWIASQSIDPRLSLDRSEKRVPRMAQTPVPKVPHSTAAVQAPAFAQGVPQPSASTQVPALVQAPVQETGPVRPRTYSDQVMNNLNQPFMEKYNSLRYGKPLDFTPGADSRVQQYAPRTRLDKDAQGLSIDGAGAVQIVDRPMTLAELDPMMVHEKDWSEYLKAMTKAASTPDFDASKDPAVLQQLESLNTAYWRFKAAKKEQAMLDKRQRLLDLDAQAAEYRAGLKSASDEEQAQFQKDRAEEQAAFLEKQARLLDNHDWSQGYSDEEKQAVADQAVRLREKAGQIRSGGDADYGQAIKQSNAEHKLWWSEQVGKIREGQQKIEDAKSDTTLQGLMARSAADVSRQEFFAAGQVQDDQRRQREAAMEYQTTQRQLMQENKLLAAQERQGKQEQTVARSAAALKGLQYQRLKDNLNNYTPDGAGGFIAKDGHILTPQETQQVQQKMQQLDVLLSQQMRIQQNLLNDNMLANPGAVRYFRDLPEEVSKVPVQSEGSLNFPDFSTMLKAKP